MVARPTDRARWATDPGTTTEPDEGMKDSGYPPDEPPERTPTNWLFNTLYQGLEWFFQVEPRSTDVMEDQPLPGDAGDKPSVGSGLNLTGGETDFTGGALVNGYRIPDVVGPGVGSGFTSYTANKDTYWDLADDGTWTAVVVASGADPTWVGVAAVTADSTRVYRVRTDGSDRLAYTSDDTGSKDYRPARPRLSRGLDLVDIRKAALTTLKGLAIQAAELAGFRTELVADLGSAPNYRYQAWTRWNDAAGALFGARIFTRRITGDGNTLQMVVVFGADLVTPQGATAADVGWIARDTSAHRFLIRGTDSAPVLRYSRIGGLTPDVTSFTDAAWEGATSGNATRYQMPLGFGFRFGGAPLNLTAAAGNLVPIIGDIIRGTGFSFTELIGDHTASQPWSMWTGPSLDGGASAVAFSSNGVYHPDSETWERFSGDHAYLWHLSRDGLVLFGHSSGGSNPWDHAAGDADWKAIARWAVDPPLQYLSIPGALGLITVGTGLVTLGGASAGWAPANGDGILAKSSSGAFCVYYRIDVPHGAELESCSVWAAVDLNSDDVRATVVRKTNAGITAPLYLDSVGPTDFTDTADINTFDEFPIQIDQLNTVDLTQYSYYLRLTASGAALVYISRVEVGYRLPRPNLG